MSPVVKQKGDKVTLPSKYLLFILSVVCFVLMLVTYHTDYISRGINSFAGSLIIPFERGISGAGTYLTERKERLVKINDLLEENRKLKEQVDELTIENTKLQQQRYELNTLRGLFELSSDYDEFEMKGARVIAKDSGNWFHSFVIDKGSADGVEVDMNVMAGSGLVGRVVSVGRNWAKVKAVIADDSNVSAMTLVSSDTLVVSGSLEQYEEDGRIPFSYLMTQEGTIGAGDKVVTSNISDKFLPGILVGYIDEISLDANNLTYSGTITPAVDFEHLEEVLVIMEAKQNPDEEDAQ